MVRIENVSFVYGGEQNRSGGVHDISMNIGDGECVVLCGESGCGKTTVTRLINGLVPHFFEGQITGSVHVDGLNVTNEPLYETAAKVGSVFQNPRSQFFNVDTTSEVTFGCENLGLNESEIENRLAKITEQLDISHLLGRNIFDLSGGEKQKIACAGAAIMEPSVYVLDEPSSNLDASAIEDLRTTLLTWKRQGRTIIVSEHRLYYLMDVADRFVYMRDGEIVKEYTPDELGRLTEAERAELGLRTPELGTLSFAGRGIKMDGQDVEISLTDFRFSYKRRPRVLDIGDMSVHEGSIVGIIGNNGAGKSTFSRCLCGLEKKCGCMTWSGRSYSAKDRLSVCYMVMQDVNHQLFTESVLDEVLISMDEDDEERAAQILGMLDIGDVKDRHPMALSGGQKQRVAIATAMAADRPVLFFDEPTSGLDYRHMLEVVEIMKKLSAEGRTIFVITHDVELIMKCCTDIIHLEHGQIREQYRIDSEGERRIKDFFRI